MIGDLSNADVGTGHHPLRSLIRGPSKELWPHSEQPWCNMSFANLATRDGRAVGDVRRAGQCAMDATVYLDIPNAKSFDSSRSAQQTI
ncbi:hypothetical protein BST61_g11283 [Cercospora zeina]